MDLRQQDMGASMSRPVVLAALVGVALASSPSGEGVLKGRDKMFLKHVALEFDQHLRSFGDARTSERFRKRLLSKYISSTL